MIETKDSNKTEVKIMLGSWLYNAGILGFLRILAADEPPENLNDFGLPKSINLDESGFILTSELLDSFEEKYFKYVIREYVDTFFNFKSRKDCFTLIKEHCEQNFDGNRFLNEYLIKIEEEISFYKLTFEKSVEKIFEMINDFYSQLIEKLNKVDESNKKIKKEADKHIRVIEKKIEDSKETFRKAKTGDWAVNVLTDFYKNKAIIGNYSIKKNTTRLNEFKETYLIKSSSFLNVNDPDFLKCVFCNQNNIEKKIDKNDFSRRYMFQKTLFSSIASNINSNFYYNNQSELFTCPYCELILMCSFAGFNKKPYEFKNIDETEYIYVNIPNLKLLYKTNKILKDAFHKREKTKTGNSSFSFAIDNYLDFISKEDNTLSKSSWVLQNIMFVELKPGHGPKGRVNSKIHYLPIDKGTAKLLNLNYNTFNSINGSLYYKEKSIYVSLRETVITKILNADSLYPLIERYFKERFMKSNYFYDAYLMAVIQAKRKFIWRNFNKGEPDMSDENLNKDLKSFRISGYNSFEIGDISIDKRKQYSYRLLPLIKQGKRYEFYNILMKIFINHNKEIPINLSKLLDENYYIDFEAMAYAFMSGFLGKKEEKGETNAK